LSLGSLLPGLLRIFFRESDTAMLEALLHKISYSGAKCLVIRLSQLLDNIRNPSENERIAMLERRHRAYYRNPQRIHELIPFYHDIYDDTDEIIDVFSRVAGLKKVYADGISLIQDISSKHCNVINSYRVTTDIPEERNL
jgi:hypothetical protein